MNDKIKDTRLIVSLSGGKDSVACCLFLEEQGLEYERVFMDTGWEDQSTYGYLDTLEAKLGKITRLKADVDISSLNEEAQQFILEEEKKLGFVSPFIRLIIKHNSFPNQHRKYCTRSLKLTPFKDYINDIEDDITVITGLRREESKSRSTIEEFEWVDFYNCWQWRPLYRWTEADVIQIHQRHDFMPNPLYLEGFSRVGCFPCIYARKKEISLLTQERIDLISRIERFLGVYTYEKNKNTKNKADLRLQIRHKETGFYLSPMFQRTKKTTPIEEVVEWSRTARGGKQMPLFDLDPPSCMKWGLCNV